MSELMDAVIYMPASFVRLALVIVYLPVNLIKNFPCNVSNSIKVILMKIIDHANQASFNSALVKKYNYSNAHLNKLFDGI